MGFFESLGKKKLDEEEEEEKKKKRARKLQKSMAGKSAPWQYRKAMDINIENFDK